MRLPYGFMDPDHPNNLSGRGGYGYLVKNARWLYRWTTCRGDRDKTGETVDVSHVVVSHDDAPRNAEFIATVLEFTGYKYSL